MRDDEPAHGVVLRELRRRARDSVSPKRRRGDLARRLCLTELRQPALLPRRVVAVDETLARGAVEQPYREGVGLCRGRGGCGLPHVLQRGAQGGALRPVVREAGTRLAPGFLGGLDTRHSGPPGWAGEIEGKLMPGKALRC